jgi:protein TonB
MQAASFLSSSDPHEAAVPARRRAISILLTLLAHALLLLLLIKLAPPHFGSSKPGNDLKTFSVAPEAQEEAATAKSPAKTRQTSSPPPTPSIPPPKIQLPPVAAPWVLTPGLEKFDVRHVPPAPQAAQQSDASASDDSSNGSSNSDRPVAFGPEGQPLYEAAWYREPTDAELGTYLKKYARPGPGFGMIACQTVPRYHVDNCEEIGETLGSGYGRAVREAAFQFLVIPPRVGGRTLVGAWVRIRIDLHDRKEP